MSGDENSRFASSIMINDETIIAEAFVKKITKTFVYPDEKYLIECCKTHFAYLQMKQEDMKVMKEVVIDIRRGDDGRQVGEFRYPILKS